MVSGCGAVVCTLLLCYMFSHALQVLLGCCCKPKSAGPRLGTCKSGTHTHIPTRLASCSPPRRRGAVGDCYWADAHPRPAARRQVSPWAVGACTALGRFLFSAQPAASSLASTTISRREPALYVPLIAHCFVICPILQGAGGVPRRAAQAHAGLPGAEPQVGWYSKAVPDWHRANAPSRLAQPSLPSGHCRPANMEHAD